jgi:hypothetical protein
MSFNVTDKLFLNKCRDLVFASVFILLSVSHFTCFALHHFNDFPDSIVKKYPLTDPRNPKCPCYKLQKKAQKEFNKVIKNKHKTTAKALSFSQSKKETKSHYPYSHFVKMISFEKKVFQIKPTEHKREKRRKRPKFSLKKGPDSCPKWQFRR